MKIKRFFSKDMRSVIRMVREELGPDAVILANNQVNGGVEIIAAVDYDETLLQPKDPAAEAAKFNERPVPQDESLNGLEQQGAILQNDLEELSLPSMDSEKNPFGQSRLSFRKNPSEPASIPAPSDDLDLEGFSQHFLEATQENDVESALSGSRSDFLQPELEEDAVKISHSGQRANAKETHSWESNSREANSGTAASSKRDKITFYQDDKLKQRNESAFLDLDGGYVAADESNTGVSPDSKNVWSQEPTLVSMRNEIQTLRSLLEQQLTGLAWGETERRNPVRAKLLRQLLELDFHATQAREIADYIGDDLEYLPAWQAALTYVTDNLPINADEFSAGGIFALLGPTGAGKTTSVAKLASKFALRYGRNNVAMITVDNYRVGAHEQLKTYARIFDIPMKVATNTATLSDAIRSLAERKFIFIDSAGLNYQDSRLDTQFELLDSVKQKINKVLVLPSTYHRTTLDEIVRRFAKIRLHSAMITKIDETTSLGGSLSTTMKHALPISFYCDGQKIPDALHVASAHELVNRSVLIAKKTNQPLNRQDVEKAFVRTHRDVHL